MRTVLADSRAHWDALMAALGSDEAAQGAAYARLYERLCSFFTWKGSPVPEELADRTLNRMGRKLAEGETLEQTPEKYALGVARFIHLETVKKEVREKEQAAAQPERPEPEETEAAEHEAQLQALEHCLEKLGDDAPLVRRYYAHVKGQKKIDERKALAADVGLSMNALRIKTLRLRKALADCVKNRMAA